MHNFDFSHGTRFLLNDIVYVVQREGHEEVQLKNLYYNREETWRTSELLTAWDKGKLIFRMGGSEDEQKFFEKLPADLDMLPPRKRAEAVRRYNIIRPFISHELNHKDLKKYLETLPKEQRPSQATFYRWVRKWRLTRDMRALMPREDLRGPKSHSSQLESIQLADKVIDDLLYVHENITLKAMYAEYLLRIEEENFGRGKEVIQKISETTFWRRVKQLTDNYILNKNRHGKPKADLIKRGSRKELIVTRPLERVEIDWTPVDVLLIDPESLQPKRPWLIYAMDKYSGYPLGFYVSFKAPDTKALKQCLLHCLLPKVYIKDMYPLVRNEWIAYGKPKTVVLDNSSINDSYDFEDTCNVLGIGIQFSAIGSGHQKGTIERAFRTFNTKFVHGLKGTTFSNPFEKSRYDSLGKACISMQGFIYMVHIAMVSLIANDYDSSRNSTPHDAWLRGWAANPHLRNPLPRTKEELKQALMTGLEERTITNKGVVIKNAYYNSVELMELYDCLQKQHMEKEKVKVRFDMSDLRAVYVYDEFKRKYIVVESIGLERMGINTQMLVPFAELELRSREKSKIKRNHDLKPIARANRDIRAIQNEERKSFIKNKNRISAVQNSRESMRSLYFGISSQGLSEIVLETPAGIDTLMEIQEGNSSIKNNNKKDHRLTDEKTKINFGFNLVSSSDNDDVNLGELPEFEVTMKEVK